MQQEAYVQQEGWGERSLQMSKAGQRGQSRGQATDMMSTGLCSKKREELSSQPSLPNNDYKINHLMTPVIEQRQQARDSRTSGSMGNLPMSSHLSNSFAYRPSHQDQRFDHMSQQEMPSMMHRQSDAYSVQNNPISVSQSVSQKLLNQSA